MSAALDPLSRSPLLAALSPEDLERFVRDCRRRRVAKRARLDSETTRELLYVLVDGRFEVSRSHPESGRQLTLFLLGPGDAHDVLTLFDDQPHDVDVVSLDDQEVLTMPVPTARQWIARCPELNRAVLPYLARRIRVLEDLSTELALHKTVTRLARLLLRHTSPVALPPAKHAKRLSLINDLSNEELAPLIGSVRVIVNRHLQNWKRAGTISTGRRQMAIRDLAAIREAAELAEQAIARAGGA